MTKEKSISEHLFDIVVELMTANTINAMRVLHTENKKAYSAKELEWLSRVIDEEELCSGEDDSDEGTVIDDLLDLKN